MLGSAQNNDEILHALSLGDKQIRETVTPNSPGCTRIANLSHWIGMCAEPKQNMLV